MYLIDSDVLMRAKNEHFRFAVVPGWWDWLEREHQADVVSTVEAVRREVLAGDDELSEWMAEMPDTFGIKSTGSDTASLQLVAEWASGAKQFRPGAAAEFLGKADYFLVAMAHSLDAILVTHEKPAPERVRSIKIPDACAAIGVECMTPWRMLQLEKAKFGLL